MAFPLELTSVLTGLTPSQLRRLRQKEIVVPEVRAKRPPLYSFRDLIALRTVAYLRAATSLQKISTAFANLDVFEMTDHPSAYKFSTDGRSIVVKGPDGQPIDLVLRKGQIETVSFAEVTKQFQNFRENTVVDFFNPHRNVQVEPHRMGGWPTVTGTRIPYDTIARIVDNNTIRPEDVEDFYPGVSAEAARDAVDFDASIREVS